MAMKLANPTLLAAAMLVVTACASNPPPVEPLPQGNAPKELPSASEIDELERKFVQIWGSGDPYSTDEAALAEHATKARTQIFGRLRSRSVLSPPLEVKGNRRFARFEIVGLHIEIEAISGERRGTRLVRKMVRAADGSSRLQSIKESGDLRVGDLALLYVRFERLELEPSPVERLTEGDWFWAALDKLPSHDTVPYLAPAPGEPDIVPKVWTNARWALERRAKMDA